MKVTIKLLKGGALNLELPESTTVSIPCCSKPKGTPIINYRAH
eukprot:SAG22_NODE_52_length_24288_cov_15.594568_18_plen_43_part_00